MRQLRRPLLKHSTEPGTHGHHCRLDNDCANQYSVFEVIYTAVGNFIARKQSLVFFLIIQMVLTIAASPPSSSCFDVECFEPKLVPHLPLRWWRNSNECLVIFKGYFDTVPTSLDESAKLDGAGFRRFWQIVLSFCLSNGRCTSTLGTMGPFGDYIHLVSFFDKESFTVAVVSENICQRCCDMKIAFFCRAGAILTASPNLYLILFLVSGLTGGGTRDNLVPPCFFVGRL